MKKPTHVVLYEKYKQLLTNPEEFFTKIKKEHSYHPALFFLIILTLTTALINIVLTSPLVISGTASFEGITWAAQLLTLIYLPIYALVYASMAALLVYIILFFFKTAHNTFKNNFKILAYAQTISLIYSVIGTVVVLATELLTGESTTSALITLFSGGWDQLSGIIAFSIVLAILLTIASWVHTLWAMMHGFTKQYEIKHPSAILLSVVALVASFIVLTILVQIISLALFV